MVLFMAAMQGIPPSYYEAAALDGATRGVMFFKITFPLLWETTRSALVFITIGALDMFGITFYHDPRWPVIALQMFWLHCFIPRLLATVNLAMLLPLRWCLFVIVMATIIYLDVLNPPRDN